MFAFRKFPMHILGLRAALLHTHFIHAKKVLLCYRDSGSVIKLKEKVPLVVRTSEAFIANTFNCHQLQRQRGEQGEGRRTLERFYKTASRYG
jgi:hypothetical protein